MPARGRESHLHIRAAVVVMRLLYNEPFKTIAEKLHIQEHTAATIYRRTIARTTDTLMGGAESRISTSFVEGPYQTPGPG